MPQSKKVSRLARVEKVRKEGSLFVAKIPTSSLDTKAGCVTLRVRRQGRVSIKLIKVLLLEVELRV